MPPGPPWKIVSPFGVLHIIKDRDALGTFIAAEELDTFNIKTIMRDLLARQCTPSTRVLNTFASSQRSTLR